MTDTPPSWEEAEAARREFKWFGVDAASAAETGAVSDVDAEDQPISPWSAERDELDAEVIAGLVAEGTGPEQARQQVETATDHERFERAVARGINGSSQKRV